MPPLAKRCGTPSIGASKPKLRVHYYDWFVSAEPQIAFTGTCRQCDLTIATDGSFIRTPITVDSLSKHTVFFMERLSRDVFCRSDIRRGRRLSYCASIEGLEIPAVMGGQRMHLHLGIGGVPSNVCIQLLSERAAYRWSMSKWGFPVVDFQTLDSVQDQHRWVRYMLKNFSPERTNRFIATPKS